MTTSPHLTLLTAGAVLAGWLSLTATLRFPEALLDPAAFPQASVAGAGLVPAVLGVIALIGSGLLLNRLVRASRHRPAGFVAAASWIGFGLMSLVLVAIWRTGGDARWLSLPAFVLFGVVAPTALAVWTIRTPRAGRPTRERTTGSGRGPRRPDLLRLLASAGLITTAVRSVVWVVNTQLPPDRGLFLTSAVLTTAALVGQPLWLVWIVRTVWAGRSPRPTAPGRLGAALLSVVLPLGFVAASLGLTPKPLGTGAPAVPSAAGSAFYSLIEAFPGIVPMPATLAELEEGRRQVRAQPPEVQTWATLEKADADGIPSEWICARTATKEHAILYLPGGGFVAPAGNGPRRFAAAISRLTKACVLLAHYRLAPEHPYPAGRDDAVRAYRWLARQVDPAKLAVMGDSAGGNLTLTSALVLRREGDRLPAALVSLSGVADLTMTATTFRTLSDRDPLLTPGNRAMVAASYLRDGRIDARDPLLSPLYADLAGLPPTMLLVGTQEVLLDDILALGDRFRAAKVPVEVQAWPGMLHAWPMVFEEAPESTQANEQLARFVSRAWSSLR